MEGLLVLDVSLVQFFFKMLYSIVLFFPSFCVCCTDLSMYMCFFLFALWHWKNVGLQMCVAVSVIQIQYYVFHIDTQINKRKVFTLPFHRTAKRDYATTLGADDLIFAFNLFKLEVWHLVPVIACVVAVPLRTLARSPNFGLVH